MTETTIAAKTGGESAAKTLTHPKYRSDIDGLRAVAVLSVVGFHAFPSSLHGGFIGVDIFFVISGFLISTIILENIQSESFSFAQFYVRRIKRIFPALLVVLFVSLLFGIFTLLTDEYRQLGRHIAAGAAFVSNYVLWGESGYFDSSSDTKILLHLWSLGIEEQFYIVWPLCLWFAGSRRINFLLVIGACAILSFVLNISSVHDYPVAAFYSPQTRFWELLVGAMLAYLLLAQRDVAKKLRLSPFSDFLALLGAALIVTGLGLITKELAFPGWWALLPTLGAAMVIAAGADTWLSRRVLSNRILVWFGLISFPLYLWHWPLLSFARILIGELPSRGLRVTLIAAAILLAWVTYRFVEKPIRWGTKGARPAVLLALGIGLTGLIAYATAKANFAGFSLRDKDKVEFSNYYYNVRPEWAYFERTKMLEKMRDDCSFYDFEKLRNGSPTQLPGHAIAKACYQRTPSAEHAVLIWGDSHAQHLYSGLRKNLPASWDVLIVASNGCKPRSTDNADSATDYCKKSNWFAQKTVEETKPDVVVVAQRDYDMTFEELQQMGRALTARGAKKVIFVGPTPRWKTELPKLMVRELWEANPERTLIGVEDEARAANDKLKERFARQDEFIYVDVMQEFCDAKGCLTRIGPDRLEGLTSWDYGHLTPIASDYFAKNRLAKAVREAAGESGN